MAPLRVALINVPRLAHQRLQAGLIFPGEKPDYSWREPGLTTGLPAGEA
jgi:hypothetical protein